MFTGAVTRWISRHRIWGLWKNSRLLGRKIDRGKIWPTSRRPTTARPKLIGHGSGKLSPKLTHEPGFYLKEYYSTLEEARANSLMALGKCFRSQTANLSDPATWRK